MAAPQKTNRLAFRNQADISMDWFVNNWELCLGFAVALFIAWMVFFKQEFELNRERGEADSKKTKQDNSQKK